MAQDSWPSPAHNNRAVTDAEYEAMAARFSDNGVYGDPTDTAVVSAGIGLNVDIRPNVDASVRGHAWTSGTSTVTLAVAANPSGATRTDRAILRLDRSDWTVRAVIKQGTPGAGVPTLTQQTGVTGVYEILLANITVQAGASSVTVTRGERYVGMRVRPCTSTSLTDPNPTVGEVAYETDTGLLRIYTGSGWRSVYQRSAPVVIDSPVSGWSNETASVIEMRSGTVHLRLGSFRRTGGTVGFEVNSRLPVLIPSAYRHANRDQFVLVYITGALLGRATIYSSTTAQAGQVWLTQHPDVTTGERILSQSGTSWVVD